MPSIRNSRSKCRLEAGDRRSVGLLQAAWDSIVDKDPRIGAIYRLLNTDDTDHLWASAPTATLLFAALSHRDLEALTRTVRDLVQRRGLQILMALQDDLAVGVLAGSTESVPWSRCPYGSLHLMYVVPTARKTGVARCLAKAFAKDAASRGCAEVWLDVMAQNYDAIACWERIGFEPMWHSMRISAGQLAGELDEPNTEEPHA
jgi:ribosomal protein S18 acetylase RimI-like enzyme